MHIGKARVLVVEDEALVRLVVAECFEHAGFIVLEAADSDTAIELLIKTVPQISLVFTDIQMPGKLDGLGLSSWVKEHFPAIPVIVTSGGLSADRTSSDLINLLHFFPKPYDLDKIVECIHATLAKRSGRA
jgi:DNA-binding NtrC family response regulator